MTINIKCPVCRANNALTPHRLQCRRCGEDLLLLYRVKGYSFKYRLILAQLLARRDEQALQQKKQLAGMATWLERIPNEEK